MVGDDVSREILETLDGLADKLVKSSARMAPSAAHQAIANIALINTARHYGYDFALNTAKAMPAAIESDKRALEVLAFFKKDDPHG